MCAYNVAAFIDEAIQSVLSQTYTNWELIISDDGSTDSTVSLINKYTGDNRIKFYQQPKNLGYIKNKNWAFKQATGELLTQLDSDDTCEPARLEKQVAAFNTYPDLKICGTNYHTIDTEGKVMRDIKYDSDSFIKEIKQDYPFWFPGLMFKRELIEEFGLFSEYFDGIYGDDFHWTLRVIEKYPVYFIKDTLYNYRIHGKSLTNFFGENSRKLIAEDILRELYRQHTETGTDQLEQNEPEKMWAFEKKLFKNKPLIAEKYRMWAAKAIDGQHWDQAKKLLSKSFGLNKTSLNYYRTLAYYLRSKRKSTITN